MINLTKVTEDQANKIEMVLNMMENHIKEQEQIFLSLVDNENFTEKTCETMRSNAEWWREAYELIFNN